MVVEKGYKNIPKVRIKEFTGEWSNTLLADISEINPSTVVPDEFEYVDLESVKGTQLLYTQRIMKEEAPSRAQRVASYDDIFYQTVRPYQKSNYHFKKDDDDYVFSTGYAQIRVNNLNDSSFIFTKLQTADFVNEVLRRCTGTSYPAINSNDLAKIEIRIPSLLEQQRIGQIFKKLDDLISLQENQVVNAEKYKQAMLQKMFPTIDKVNPELRFAGFKDEWKETKLGDFVDTYRGLTYKPSNVSECGVRVLRSSNIDVDTFKTFEDDVFVDEDAVNIPLVEEGDILVTSANGSINLVGKHAIIENVDSKMVHGGFMLLLKTDNPYFVNSWMSSSQYNRVLGMIQGGNGSIGNLSRKAFNNAKMTVPQSEEEQKLIGQYFKTLDQQIALVNQRVEEYRTLKQGLLQKMFI